LDILDRGFGDSRYVERFRDINWERREYGGKGEEKGSGVSEELQIRKTAPWTSARSC
jgi:hypothetical protein